MLFGYIPVYVLSTCGVFALGDSLLLQSTMEQWFLF